MPKVLLKSLPERLQRSLHESLDAESSVFIPANRHLAAVAITFVSAAWPFALFTLSNDYRWSLGKLAAFCILTVVSSYFVVRGSIELLRRFHSPFREGLLVTRHNIFEIGRKWLDIRPIGDLYTIDHSHKFTDRRYVHSEVQLSFEDRIRRIRVNDASLAEDAADRIAQLRKHHIEATARCDAKYLAGSEMWEEFANGTRENVSPWKGEWAQPIAAVVLTVCLVAASFESNKFFDDRLSWNDARAENSARSFRTYLLTHPNGRWSAEADERLTALYDAAESKYLTKVGNGGDKDAVGSMIALLRHATEKREPRVAVRFNRTLDIPPDLVDKVRKDFEVKKVIPLGNAFSEDKMNAREATLFGVLLNTLHEVVPDDVLEFTTDCSGDCPSFTVNYEISFLESIYYDLKEKGLPRQERNWSPGILINWKFDLEIPEDSNQYAFTLEAAPAEQVNYESPDEESLSNANSDALAEVDKANFYDAMVESAFSDFREHLLFNLGIGPEPKDQVEKPDAD